MAGNFIDIVSIDAPSSAASGATVDVTIKIKNHYPDISAVHVYCVGVVDYNSGVRFINWQYYHIPYGETHSFTGSFVMPPDDTTIHAYAYYRGTDGANHLDDEKTKGVYLSEAPEGTISRKELEYDESRANIPAYNVFQGERGLVHIRGRNDTSETQRMGIHWYVYDPDGVLVEEYAAWEAWPYTGAGDDHEFIGGRFNLDKVGTYTIKVYLSMNPDAPVIVDTYNGILCTTVPECEFSQFEITDYSVV